MLVIVSDLHLTDGSTGMRMPVGAFRLFRQRLEDMAYDASKRDETTYKPIEEFDLLLLGDVFDLLRTTQWNNELNGAPGYARPWDKLPNPNFVKKVGAIVDGVIMQNADSLQVLHDLAMGTSISLPPATKTGQVNRQVSRDRRSKSRLPLKVNIHYMCGNHDWIFHLPGAEFNLIRQKVIDAMGLSNSPLPFPYTPDESGRISAILSQHRVFARHGDFFDPSNFTEKRGRDYASIGDAMCVEIFNPFRKSIQDLLGDKLPAGLYKDLDEMGSIRPSVMTPVWVATVLERHQVAAKFRGDINEIWKGLVEKFLDLEFLKELDESLFGTVDALRFLLGLLAKISLDKLDDLAPLAERLVGLHSAFSGGGEMGFDKNALKEDAYKSGEAKFIVYGHTHGFKVLPLRTLWKNGKAFDQVYINSGTWHPIHEAGKGEDSRHSFFTYKTMSFLSFYLENERKGRAFETWMGMMHI